MFISLALAKSQQCQRIQVLKLQYSRMSSSENQSNPTLKGRFLNLEKLAKKMRSKLSENDKKIKDFLLRNEEGTEATISNDRIAHIRDLLVQRLEQIDYKINKHLSEQKQKNHQMMELIGVIKNEKNNLQKLLEELQERIYQIQVKIGQENADV